MGVKIHYCGHLHNYNEIEDLICDVADICLYNRLANDAHSSLQHHAAKGLMITPEGSESIWLTFLPTGMLYDVAHFIYTSYPENEKVDEHRGRWISTKTRYAGLDAHMAIIKMFRYLSQRYFDEF
jgi:hypothetical protein